MRADSLADPGLGLSAWRGRAGGGHVKTVEGGDVNAGTRAGRTSGSGRVTARRVNTNTAEADRNSNRRCTAEHLDRQFSLRLHRSLLIYALVASKLRFVNNKSIYLCNYCYGGDFGHS